MRRRRRVVLAVAVLFAHLARAALAPAVGTSDTEARLRYLERRIAARDDTGLAPGHPFDGEWRLLTLSNAIVAATNAAFREPSTRERQAARVVAWTTRLESGEVRAYDAKEWGGEDAFAALGTTHAHAGYLGHVLLAEGAACLLGVPVDPVRHDAVAASLARRLADSGTGLLETYPGEVYVTDNVVTAAGLALHDRCRGAASHQALLRAWIERLRRERVDASTGVLVFAPGQPGRGAGAAWNSLYLPLLDEVFAEDQARALREGFSAQLAPLVSGIREWPRGVEGPGDVDSGPLVLGLSLSATGYGVAAAVTLGDDAWRDRLLATAELAGASVGLADRRYLTAPLVGDSVVLAAKTATRWDRRFISART